MPFLVGLALIVAALIWADEKLKAYGISWTVLAAALAALVVLNQLARRVLRRHAAARLPTRLAPAISPRLPPEESRAPEQAPRSPSATQSASRSFRGGHVLASGLETRLFLRYRDAAGASVDSIFELYQIRAFGSGERIAQLHGHCFTANAFLVIAMRDVLAIGDERTGAAIPDLDAFCSARRRARLRRRSAHASCCVTSARPVRRATASSWSGR